MDFKLTTKRGKKEFKDAHLTIRNYYELKKADLPFEDMTKACEDEDYIVIAEMLEVILKDHGVEKGDIVNAPMFAMKNMLNVFMGLITENMDIEGDANEGDGENSGELI